jgi:ribonuclease HI
MKHYVVWVGRKTGIFSSWEECEKSVKGFTNASYRSYPSKLLAERALVEGIEKTRIADKQFLPTPNKPILDSLVVDASCRYPNVETEVQGIDLRRNKLKFHIGPIEGGSINIGEFLAIVYGIQYLQLLNSHIPIYSDSKIAIEWVHKKHHCSDLRWSQTNRKIFDQLEWANNFLRTTEFKNQILKWETKLWGENPADFNRK